MLFKLAMGTAVALGLIVFICAGQNLQSVNLILFGMTLPVPLGLALVGCWGSGLVGCLALLQTKVKEVKSQQITQKWEAQDAKMVQEHESDTIKLLQAKVATLEVALKSALKKKEG